MLALTTDLLRGSRIVGAYVDTDVTHNQMCADDGGDIAAIGHDVLVAADPHLEDARGRARGYVDIDNDARRDDDADVGGVAVIAGKTLGGVRSQSTAKADILMSNGPELRKNERGRELKRPTSWDECRRCGAGEARAANDPIAPPFSLRRKADR